MTGWSTRRKIVVGTIPAFLILGAIGSLARDPAGTATQSGPPTQSASLPSTPASTNSTSPNGVPVVYTLSMIGTAQGSSSLAIAGETKLPDGAVIEILASRAFHYRSEDNIRATNAGEQMVTVSSGRFQATLTLDESNLLVLVGTGPGEDQIDQLDKDLTACAQFQTGLDLDGQPRQPASVARIVGDNGEALATSPLVTVFGSATAHPSNWLELVSGVALVSPLFGEITTRQGFAPEQVALDGFCV